MLCSHDSIQYRDAPNFHDLSNILIGLGGWTIYLNAAVLTVNALH